MEGVFHIGLTNASHNIRRIRFQKFISAMRREHHEKF
jgi:hypothetical protein